MKNNNTMQVAWAGLFFFKEHSGAIFYQRPP
jgi:hypothetical protein